MVATSGRIANVEIECLGRECQRHAGAVASSFGELVVSLDLRAVDPENRPGHILA